MIANDDSDVEQNGPHPRDFEASFGWDFLSEVWSSRRFVATSIIAGLILGGIGGHLLPKIYASKIQVKATSIERYDSLFSAFIAKNEMDNAEGKLNRPK